MVKRAILVLLIIFPWLSSCGEKTGAAKVDPNRSAAVIIDSGSANDRSFNEYTLLGVRRAAERAGLDFFSREPQSITDYEAAVEATAQEGADLIVTVGFRMGDATAKAARRHRDIHFIIVDNGYYPGAGCAETVKDCYSEEGGLSNVTSLLFAEDQLGYLAGVLAACMSRSEIIASVAGVELPPVVRFVKGFEKGARSFKPQIAVLNQFIPDFNDPQLGEVVALGFIQEGADVLFGVGGNTGNGALKAAHDAGLMAIGVDVDQYYTYPEVASVLISSASKNVDIAADMAVQAFADGTLNGGIRLATLANKGIGLSPYHAWADRVPTACDEAVQNAGKAIIADPTISQIQ